VLTYDKDFVEHGVPDLFSAEAYDIAWTKYEELMIKRLNSITAGTYIYLICFYLHPSL